MKIDDILALVNAGFTSDQISKMYSDFDDAAMKTPEIQNKSDNHIESDIQNESEKQARPVIEEAPTMDNDMPSRSFFTEYFSSLDNRISAVNERVSELINRTINENVRRSEMSFSTSKDAVHDVMASIIDPVGYAKQKGEK